MWSFAGEQLRSQAFVSEQRGLSSNHIEVGGDAANVTVVGEVKRARESSTAAC